MSFKNFENAKSILYFCVEKLNTNNEIYDSRYINDYNPILLINSYNNLATCLIKQYKEFPNKYKNNLGEEYALKYLNLANKFIEEKKVNTGLGSN